MYGNDWEYAHSRLQGTIVRLGEEPVFVHGVQPGMKALLAKLEDIYTDFYVNANELNLVPVPLGMCNFSNTISYLSRIPLRRDWRQGLRRENFKSSNINHALIPPEVLSQVIKGQYPSFEEALKKATDAGISVAWHRNWALSHDGKLFYKRDKVGTSKGGVLLLDKPFQYLAEALEEAV